jgi:hypothetical protein
MPKTCSRNDLFRSGLLMSLPWIVPGTDSALPDIDHDKPVVAPGTLVFSPEAANLSRVGNILEPSAKSGSSLADEMCWQFVRADVPERRCSTW